jgi:hypothetical protein
MSEQTKFSRLRLCLERFIRTLERTQNVGVHHEINQFYYMQKAEELKLLIENFEAAMQRQEKVRAALENSYNEVFCKWQKDARKLSAFIFRSS